MKQSDITTKLLQQVAKDDNKAFESFYDLYFKRVARFASYFVKSDMLCQEIISDVFFAVWQNRKKLPLIQNIEAYLYTSVRNRALYYLNQSHTVGQIPVNELSIGILSDNRTPEDITLTEELQLVINNAIADLPERCRLVFLMSREEELKYKEIAEILSISEKTVNAQMVSAIKKIGQALQKYMSIISLIISYL